MPKIIKKDSKKQNKKTKRKGGPGRHPWKPTPYIIHQLEKYSKLQLNLEQIASCIGIGYSTLMEKKNSFPEIADAIKRGRDLGVAEAAQTVMESLSVDRNLTAAFFYLKCHGGWVEKQAKQELEHTGKIEIVRTIVGQDGASEPET